jgi:hypothetical protein
MWKYFSSRLNLLRGFFVCFVSLVLGIEPRVLHASLYGKQGGVELHWALKRSSRKTKEAGPALCFVGCQLC